VGDWNEPASTLGIYSPRWIANQAGARIAVPTSRAGHGRIDYVMYVNCKVTHIFKDTSIPEWSDHEPVIFTVTK
jgi:hypothetical protein